jgi:hypothetical protein
LGSALGRSARIGICTGAVCTDWDLHWGGLHGLGLGRSARIGICTGAACTDWDLHWCSARWPIFTRDDLHGWGSARGTVRIAVGLDGSICLKGGLSEGILVVGLYRGGTDSLLSFSEQSCREEWTSNQARREGSDWLPGCHIGRSASVGGRSRSAVARGPF